MRYLLVVPILAILAGCGEHRNVTIASKMVEQELNASQQFIEKQASLEPISRLDATKFMEELYARIGLARAMNEPVTQFLDAGDGVQPPTDVEMATIDHAEFKRHAEIIIPLAKAEAEKETSDHQLWVITKRYIGSVVGSGLSIGLLATGGGGLLTSLFAALRSSRKGWAIAKAAISYGSEMTDVALKHSPVADVEAVKDAAAVEQKEAGIHKDLVKLL